MKKRATKDRDKTAPTPMQMAVNRVAKRREALTAAMSILDQAQRAVVRAHAELQEADADKMRLAMAEMHASSAGLNS